MKNITAHYRGFVQGLITQQHHAIFATRHKEGQPGSLHRFDLSAEVPSLTEAALACGASALTSDDKNIYIAGDNGKLYQAELIKGAPKAVSKIAWDEKDRVIALCMVANSQLVLLHEEHICIVPLKGSAEEQGFTLEIKASCVAASPDGLWFAVGDTKGHIYVYEYLDDAWQLSSKAKVHQAKVTTIQFEKNELRFYSAGEDNKLFNTHAQGKLEPLDKGRNSNHQDAIQAITLGSERFFTAADDKTVKAWPFAGGQPVTLKETLPKPKHMALIEHLGRAHLIVVGQDQSFTLAALTPDDKFSELRMRIKDGYEWARTQLADRQASERDQGIELLAQYDDKKSLDLLNKHLKNEQSKDTRLAIIDAFEKSKHHYANTLLLDKLADKGHSEIRLTALEALKKRLDKSDLQAYEKALSTQHIDIGLEALKALAPLAKKDQRAENILIQALQHDKTEIGIHALDLLEKHYDKKSPKASLLALKSQHNSIARAALIRLYQRKLLDQFDVKRTLLLAQDHNDQPLRQTALLVSILGQNNLAKALKTRAKNLAHQLQEIEDFDLMASTVAHDADKDKKVATPKPSSIKSLTEEDYRVLLQGMSNSHADVSFTAAFALATLQDQRAFGLLVLLSREISVSIRAGVCQALAWLNQAESTEQLRILLNDREAAVRDIAFSALLYISNSNLDVAAYGLETKQQDVHDRSLKTLLDCFSTDAKRVPEKTSIASKLKGLFGAKETAKKKPTKSSQAQALELLSKALNGPFEPIRQEAFKATLNRKLGGSDQATLELLLNSHRKSIHVGVLNELKAKSEVLPIVEWVQPLLFSLLNNDHQEVRQAAFDFIISRKKRFDRQAALAEAVKIGYLDVRESAFTYLTKYPSKAHQTHLQVMVGDEHESIRIHALQALVTAQNEAAVLESLSSEYDDIKVNAAMALASWGNDKAYQPLIDFLQTPKPAEKAHIEQWKYNITRALQGVTYLGDSRAYDIVLPFLDHKDADFVNGAAHALPWITQNASSAIKLQLVDLQKDERAIVKSNACIALALLGDSRANTVLSFIEENHALDAYQLMAAKASLSNINPLSIQYDLENDSTQLSAMTMLFAHELLLHSEAPSLSTWALSLGNAEVQFISAKLLSQYHDAESRWEVLRSFIINKQVVSGAKNWTISSEDLQHICLVLVHGDGHSKTRTMQLLQCLDQRLTFKHWQLQHSQWQSQHQALISKLDASDIDAPNTKEKPIWQQRAFGAFLGLLRQEYGYGSNMPLQALNAIVALAKSAPELVESTQSCLLALLNNQNYNLRHKAFEQLQALGTDTELLGNAATTSPRNDIAKQGLMLLTQHYPIKQSKTLLEEMVGSDDETLSVEAYQLYQDDQGLLAVAPFALDSHNIALRSRAVNELAAQYDDKKAQKLLLSASANSEPKVAIKAMAHLAEHQHSDAFTHLSQRLTEESSSQNQSLLIRGMQQLKDTKVASFLLEYLLNNPLCQYDENKLLKIVASYRSRDTFAPLLDHLKAESKPSHTLLTTLLTITGFDQNIKDFEEETNDNLWLEKAHPFHEDLLLQLFQSLVELKLNNNALGLWPALAWMQNKGAEQALSEAVNVMQAEELPTMIQAISYRLKRREGSAESLLGLLTHKDINIQFLAAESLALNGHNQGFNVLFAAIDYQENDDFRKRAVLALGKLADERCLEKILKLAEDKEHYLNEPATEAIGHMGKSEHGDKIFKLITASLDDAYPYGDMAKHAIRGLRYLNTLAAWQFLLQHINSLSNNWNTRELALTQLKHWDTEASRDCVLKQIREDDDGDVVEAAHTTARHYWPLDKEAIDVVDIALLQGHCPETDDTLFERLGKFATAEQLLELLSADFADEDSADETIIAIAQALQAHTDLSDSALLDAIQAKHTRVVGIASRLLNRQPKLTKPLSKALSERSADYLSLWEKAYSDAQNGSYSEQEYLQETQSCLLALLATQVVHSIYDDTLLKLLATQEKTQRTFQEKILRELKAKEKISDKDLLSVIESLQQATLPSVRGTADQLMAKHTKTAKDLSWESFLTQPQVLQSGQFTADMQQAASDQAHQAQVLPTLIQQQDSDTLLSIAQDDDVKESLRVGAIEGLACILTEKASKALSDLHKNTKDTDLAKQAYRALRRQQRQLEKKQAINQTAGA